MSYKILFKQCGSDHYTKGRSHGIDYIVIHYSGTKASAKNNAAYFSRNERQGASAHYFVDDISPEIYQSVKDADTAWHAGTWPMNCRSIGIETVSAGENFSSTEVGKLAWLTQRLMKKYGVPSSHIIRHYDVTRKLCPAPYISGSKWAALKKRITGSATTSSTSTSSSTGSVDLGSDLSVWGPKYTKELQRQRGTVVDGVISGQNSAAKKYHPGISGTFQYSSGGSKCMKSLQSFLIKKGYPCGSSGTDGYYGPDTIKAHQRWLKALGYSIGSAGVDGYHGADTSKAMAKALKAGKYRA